MRSKKLGFRKILLPGLLLTWITAIALGMRVLLDYQYAAGPGAEAPARLPAEIAAASHAGRWKLIMTAHPDCPCTVASLDELAIVMARLRGKLEARVILFKPGATDAQIRASDLWAHAAAIPGVFVSGDREGIAVAALHAHVSGQTMLYDPQGRLVFSGGLTDARSHEGDNVGCDAVIDWVRGKPTSVGSTPVFGCSLDDPDADALQADPSWKR